MSDELIERVALAINNSDNACIGIGDDAALDHATGNQYRSNAIAAIEATGATELIEALQAILNVRVDGHYNIWAGANRCKDIARAAIACATGAA